MTLEQIDQRLTQSFGRQRVERSHFAPLTGAVGGISTETDPQKYRWDGLKRGGDPEQPKVALQYTLAGEGCFQSGPASRKQTIHRIGPGEGFVCHVPSAHRYWLPEDSGSWRFVWLFFYHPYAGARMIEEMQGKGLVFRAEPGDRFVSAIMAVVQGLAVRKFGKVHDLEEALLTLSVSFSRFRHDQRYPRQASDRLLEKTRNCFASHPDKFKGVKEVASALGYSRGHFTELFRTTTGLTPARYLADLRLEAARQTLMGEGVTVAEAARRHGYTDASHLRKALAKSFQLQG